MGRYNNNGNENSSRNQEGYNQKNIPVVGTSSKRMHFGDGRDFLHYVKNSSNLFHLKTNHEQLSEINGKLD